MSGGQPAPVPLLRHPVRGGGHRRPPRCGGIQGGVTHDLARAVSKGPWSSPLSFLLWVIVPARFEDCFA
jgi:hypothetical protein